MYEHVVIVVRLAHAVVVGAASASRYIRVAFMPCA
jgi:hypothetical protein